MDLPVISICPRFHVVAEGMILFNNLQLAPRQHTIPRNSEIAVRILDPREPWLEKRKVPCSELSLGRVLNSFKATKCSCEISSAYPMNNVSQGRI